MKKNLIFLFALLGMIACQPKQTLDYSVFEGDYYYMSTEERAAVWAQVPEDTLAANAMLHRWHDAFLMEQETPAGSHYIDFSQPMPMGGELALSQLVGKTDYVLIDFWASWCRPCRELMPRLKALYESQPEGRLEIVGVSLDDEQAAWIGCIERLDLPWAHMSDLQGRQNAAAVRYGIFCIPTLVLIDREGTIVARGCDEDKILSILEE